MYTTRTLSVNIARAPGEVYAFVVNPENLPQWAGGLCQSVVRTGSGWQAQTPQGVMQFRFAEKNSFGVLDHYVTPSPGGEIYVPMRVLPNGSGSTVLFTLFQLPGMADDDFARDARLVEQDLQTLKQVLEQ